MVWNLDNYVKSRYDIINKSLIGLVPMSDNYRESIKVIDRELEDCVPMKKGDLVYRRAGMPADYLPFQFTAGADFTSLCYLSTSRDVNYLTSSGSNKGQLLLTIKCMEFSLGRNLSNVPGAKAAESETLFHRRSCFRVISTKTKHGATWVELQEMPGTGGYVWGVSGPDI